jgi:hypothetical protein
VLYTCPHNTNAAISRTASASDQVLYAFQPEPHSPLQVSDIFGQSGLNF